MSAATMDRLSSMSRPIGVSIEPLEVSEPFVDLARRFAHLPGTVVLLSGGTLDCARYHVLGVDPWLTVRGQLTRTTIAGPGTTVDLEGDPFTALSAVLDHCGALPVIDGSPMPGGLVGYFAYDLKDCLERLPRTSIDDLGLPLMHLVAPRVLLVRDRRSGRTTLVSVRLAGEDDAVAGEGVARVKDVLAAPAPARGVTTAGRCVSAFSREEYMAAVEACRRYIVEGDIYQVNMSQRFETSFHGNPFDTFADMYAVNPAPFFAYLDAGDHRIVSTSMERFLHLRDGVVETRPIKGTRPRGATAEQDEALRAELRESTKEDAELSMIVDLLRNDIGKVCGAGSVRVTEHKRLEGYQNVHHLVSTVTGTLGAGKDAVDLLRATFPGGSITGCPKIRAMEVIDELEPVRRHVYTGSIGYVGFDGSMDLSIAIRTATFTGDRAVFSVGGGIVYDSDPASEFEETLHKGRTLMAALHTEDAVDGGGASATVWQDGMFKPRAQASVPFDSEGLSYGLGFFETLRVHEGRPVLLDAHVERFERAWRELFGTPPPDVTWADVVAHLMARNGLSGEAVVKLVAAAANPRGVRLAPTILATAAPYVPRPALTERGGLRLVTYPHPRESHLADHKTLNYLHYRQAGEWARARGGDEAVILNVDGTVSETNSAGLCAVIGETVVFPTSRHALPGTMAATVRRFLPWWGFTVVDRPLSPADLAAADLVIVANSVMGAVPALSLDGAPLRHDGVLCDKLTHAVLGRDGLRADPTQR